MRKSKQDQPKERIEDLVAIIHYKNREVVRFDSWRYYSILDALRWLGVERQEAMDAAKRVGRTHEELTFKIGENITVRLERGING